MSFAQTEKSIQALLHHSFGEMFRLSQKKQDIVLKDIKAEYIDEHSFKSIMFTVSSSNFRLVLLLHFPPKSALTSAHSDYLSHEATVAEQHYHDYVCELGNNFCGVVCRVLGAANFSTGMSTPNILANAKSILNMRTVGIDLECHAGGFSGSLAVFCASMCLFMNKGVEMDLNIPIASAVVEEENLGELEFF